MLVKIIIFIYYMELNGIANLNQTKKRTKKCQHNWVVDYIDLTPDKSQQIQYCSKCEETKNSDFMKKKKK